MKELNSDWELYDLATDPYERVNLAKAMPELLESTLADFQVHTELNNVLDR